MAKFLTNQTAKACKVSIVVPTYNERENVALLCKGIREVLAGSWDYEIIIVDDNSPDGTGNAVRQLMDWDSAVRLLERPAKQGLGSAVVDGFNLATGDYLVMMDADLSHRPDDLPQLLDALSKADIAVGSRYIPGGRTIDWPRHRRLASRCASIVSRVFLGLKVRDATSGFAAFRKETIDPILPELNATGFKLLIEILTTHREVVVKEVPITFVDRLYGKSKMSGTEVLALFRLCLKIRLT